ncbi:MAG: hypothetical protein KC503_12420, partial [Myxococcales bacterium]|nr:hypothetical protein [Myxococcales bacterium]
MMALFTARSSARRHLDSAAEGLYTLREGIASAATKAAGKAQTAAGSDTRQGFATPHAAFVAATLREGPPRRAT